MDEETSDGEIVKHRQQPFLSMLRSTKIIMELPCG